MSSRDTGPWQQRVQFAPGGGFAYRPGEVLVPEALADAAGPVLRDLFEGYPPDESRLEAEPVGGEFARFTGVPDPPAAVEGLHRAAIAAQVNHVLFATCCCPTSLCPPHPADPRAAAFYANPFYANPFYANPFYANPFYANPFYANPFYANPFYANPFYANPFYADADVSPFANPAAQSGGRRRSSAKPANPPQDLAVAGAPNSVRIVVLDTGYADKGFQPTGLNPDLTGSDFDDVPDEDADQYLDPAAGHGTFIAGVIEQLVPGCKISVLALLSTYGDGDEVVIAQKLEELAALPAETRPHLVNLSFGGYSPMGMHRLAVAVSRLHLSGTTVVASAGNDGTCLPMYPAVLPGVVGVAALDQDDRPASFSNYGPWLRACTLGVDVVSTFFEGFDGAEPPDAKGVDADAFRGWAVWSGTSFAAPRVVAALAQQVAGGRTPHEAVRALIDDPTRRRVAMMGTVVLPAKR